MMTANTNAHSYVKYGYLLLSHPSDSLQGDLYNIVTKQ